MIAKFGNVDRFGRYTVKSEYYLARIIQKERIQSTIGGPYSDFRSLNPSFWKGVWRLSLSSKLLVFLWSTLTKTLPMNRVINKR